MEFGPRPGEGHIAWMERTHREGIDYMLREQAKQPTYWIGNVCLTSCYICAAVLDVRDDENIERHMQWHMR